MVSVFWLACRVAINLWDDESFITLAERMVTAARGTGTLLELPSALAMAATAAMLTGDLAAATACVEQLDAVDAVTGTMRAVHGWLALTAWQGQADRHASGGRGRPGRGRPGGRARHPRLHGRPALQRPRPLRGGGRGGQRSP